MDHTWMRIAGDLAAGVSGTGRQRTTLPLHHCVRRESGCEIQWPNGYVDRIAPAINTP